MVPGLFRLGGHIAVVDGETGRVIYEGDGEIVPIGNSTRVRISRVATNVTAPIALSSIALSAIQPLNAPPPKNAPHGPAKRGNAQWKRERR